MQAVIRSVKKILIPYLGMPKEVYVIFISRIVNALGAFVFPLLTLLLTKKIGMTEASAGVWLSLGGLLFMPAGIIGGKIADSFGRKKVIIICDFLAASSYIACALMEPSMNMVYLIMLTSIFFGIGDPAHGALIADLTNPDNRDGAYSLSYLGWNMGFAIGPMIGGLLFENHLRLMFIIDAATAIIATSLILIFIKETIGITKEDLGEDRKMEERVEGSIISVLLSRPILIYFSLILFGYNFAYSQWGFIMPLHVEQNFINEGAKLFGKLSSFNGVIVMIFTPIITSLFVKKRNIKKVFYGGVLYAIGFGMLGFISTKIAFILSVFIFTLGEILVTISFMPFIANHTPASHRGRMNSMMPLLMGIGYAIGPLGMGKILDYTSVSTGWKIVGLIMTISTIMMFILGKIDENNSKAVEKIVDENDIALQE